MSPPPPGSVAAVIAGGRGTRLGGANKSALTIDGRTIFDRQLEVLRPLFARVLVVANEGGPWSATPLEVVPDRRLGQGPLAGIEAALVALRAGEPGVVCVACDMPFLARAVLESLRDHRPADLTIVPEVAGHPQPLLARYGRSALPLVQAALDRGERRVVDVLRQLGDQRRALPEDTLRSLDPTLMSFSNLNTPDDVEAAERHARHH